ncbi:cytochrome P450 [Niallia sp. 01092]|uniref:cytochrome P450 n=1 Tax=unclassified Niallia TaxID=2837522 RepID=UPI0020796915|nr:cytochrome P450 [Bacillus sp. F19]
MEMRKMGKTVPGPKEIPFIGNLLEVGSKPHEFFKTCVEKYGPVVRVRLEKDRDTYLLSRPQDIQYVLKNSQKLFAKGYHRDRILSMVLGNGLVTSEGDFWLRQRRLSQPAFHKHRIEKYADTMTHYASRMLRNWENGQMLDLHKEMMQCTMEIVAKTLFDIDLQEAEHQGSNQVGKALDQVFHEYVNQYTSITRMLLEMLPFSLPTPGNKRLKEGIRQLDQVIYEIIEHRKKENRDRGDLLSMLIAAQDDDGKGMTSTQLRDEVMTLFLAGHETTANVLSWTIYLLAQHADAEEKLVTELKNVLQGRLPSLSDIPHLPYTQAIINESMRLYPPVWFISREPLEDIWIDEYCLPAGCEVAVSQWVMHRHPDYFSKPDSFVPERWFREFEKSLPSYVYFPFGAGPRVCIGNNFAIMEATLLLASIMQMIHMELDHQHDVVPEPSITLRPKNGIRVRVEKRNN